MSAWPSPGDSGLIHG